MPYLRNFRINVSRSEQRFFKNPQIIFLYLLIFLLLSINERDPTASYVALVQGVRFKLPRASTPLLTLHRTALNDQLLASNIRKTSNTATPFSFVAGLFDRKKRRKDVILPETPEKEQGGATLESGDSELEPGAAITTGEESLFSDAEKYAPEKPAVRDHDLPKEGSTATSDGEERLLLDSEHSIEEGKIASSHGTASGSNVEKRSLNERDKAVSSETGESPSENKGAPLDTMQKPHTGKDTRCCCRRIRIVGIF